MADGGVESPGPGDTGRTRSRPHADGFGRDTGALVVVNTSFNVAEMPIENRPRDAVARCAAALMGPLVIGPFFLRRPEPSTGYPWT
ncbi:carbamoyltransferase C-terminal domain-containing protein [Streptomyces sp. NPDC056361]|uniref:carbamoyltransferase C-terminal domain-containing protein n=1 Tax=Streptomyces sp. NPDC056361 TaxID=3345795 RepID=UPI0035D5D77A